MEVNIVELISKSGFNILDIAEFATKIHGFMSIAKEKMHLLKQWEDSLNLKPNQKLIYSFIPVHSTDPKNNEIFICVQVMELEEETGKTLITEDKYTFKAFEQAENVLSLIPKG
jgi:hypothetical protein